MAQFRVSIFFLLFFAALFALGQAQAGISLLLSLAIHEIGHIAIAKILGCKIEKLAIQPLGGYLYLAELLEVQPALERRIALAGPAANLLAAAATMALTPYHPQGFISMFLRANFTLMAFNLLPALPLDGGRVLRGILAGWGSYYRATKAVIVSGAVCGVLLLGLAFWQLLRDLFNPTVFAAAGFLLYNAWVERKQLLVPLLRYVLARQDSLRNQKLMAADTIVASPGARVNEVLKHIRPQKYYQVSVLDKDYSIAGTLTEHQLLQLVLAGTGQSSLQEAIRGLGERTD